MKRLLTFILGLTIALAAHAELQNIEFGGLVHTRGRYWHNTYSPLTPRFDVPYGRPLGQFGSSSRHRWDSHGPDNKIIEHRTLIKATADMTDDVSAVITLESFDIWGEDFRSDYLTGADSRAVTDNDIEVIEAYVNVDNLFEMPLRLRLGRQSIKFDDGWLVNDRPSSMRAFIYDGVTLTLTPEPFTIDLFWTKLEENSPLEQDGDVDFSGIHAEWAHSDAFRPSLYWYWLRDARATSDTSYGVIGEHLEALLGLDDYPVTNLHTIGTHIEGDVGAWDYLLRGAYQFGDASSVGVNYRRFVYGDDDADFDAWAADGEVGYTLDMTWSPRVYLGGAYFSGEDNRDLNFWEWLIAPVLAPRASVSFNRLFAGGVYTWHFDPNKDFSNFWQIRGGVEFTPLPDLSVLFRVAHFEAVEPFDRPIPGLGTTFSFLTDKSDTDLGTSIYTVLTYNFSEDYEFKLGWEHLFAGDGLREGNYTSRYGHQFMGGIDDDDADYFFFESKLAF